jgi:hypothetical protein
MRGILFQITAFSKLTITQAGKAFAAGKYLLKLQRL